MERIIDRFDKYMKLKGINDNQVTVNAVLSVGLIGNARKEGRDLGKKAVDKILKFYQDINRVWLLTGEGEMLITDSKTPIDRKPPLIRILDILSKKGYSLKSFDALTGKRYGEWFFNRAIAWEGNNDGAMREWAELVSKTFPEFPLEYILYGVPLKDCSTTDILIPCQDVPIYEFESGVFSAIFNGLSVTPVNYMRVPNLPIVDGAIYIRGESMSPLIKSGDIVMFKKKELSIDNILWGEIYLLSFVSDGDPYTAVKYIHKAELPDYVRLVSFNPSFAPKDIPMSSITALALVKASLTYHTME